MAEESAVKVCVRVRPLIEREESAQSENPEPPQFFWKADKKSIHQVDDGYSGKSFSFDRVFVAEETTKQLYQDIAKPLVVSSVEGYNGTIFAYGQTSSGKTFTMMGSDRDPGVIPLAVEDVFQTIQNCPQKEFLLRVSYMEIYNETVSDLLVDSWKRKPLEVREALNKNIYVADLTEELVTSPAQALAWIRKGEKNRHYGKTKMNQRSSRSHAIFRMILESRERSDPSGENADGAIIVSHLNLVDLAGSERASQTGAEGTRFKEGCNINRSLFTLGQVIKKLTDENQRGFTNYRDSKLTRILQNSLGGNAKTVIICTITPVTLDETLSTLQFASTAKKMKNDPHVTEVSDDGALLKRYRNEIVDLKRRLHEVSSVTQTTATEKEVLSQLLQEKDQLQREQEDRIRNLTQLLVTSSSQVLPKRMPKRRVTWGGKMLRAARASTCMDAASNLSFAEPVHQKRKVDLSYLTELGEDDEDFDSNWEIPDEPLDEMDGSVNTVTSRRGQISSEGQASELDLQKQEVAARLQALQERAAELDAQLRAEARQRREEAEKVKNLEDTVSSLERRLEEQNQTRCRADGQVRKEFAETLQLCETLASERDTVVRERDYLRQELGMFIEQTKSLEVEKTNLSQELKEKRGIEEFEYLEEELRKEQEGRLCGEISSLKAEVEARDLRCLELQEELEQQKRQRASVLHAAGGDGELAREVAELRRSLSDAEAVSRDAKKEWAVLRSQNIMLEELKATLSAGHQKMEAEVSGLRSQLEAEKRRYKQMQSDLQRELGVVFEENAKLTALLDGKVPKHLVERVELEGRLKDLNQDLAASRRSEEDLRARLAELPAPEEQATRLTEELSAVRAERDGLADDLLETRRLLDAAEQREAAAARRAEEEKKDLLASAAEEELKAQQLRESLQAVAEQKNLLDAELEKKAEMVRQQEEHLEKTREEVDLLRADLQENVDLMIETQGELRMAQQKVGHLQERVELLSVQKEELESRAGQENPEEMPELRRQVELLAAERDGLLAERSAGVEELQRSTMVLSEEKEQLQEALELLRQEKKQIREQLDESVGTYQIQVSELSSSLQALTEQKRQLEDDLQQNMEEVKILEEKLQGVEAERDVLLSEKKQRSSREEMEELQSRAASLSEEKEQLQEALELLRQEKMQLKEQLDQSVGTYQIQVSELSSSLEDLTGQKRQLEEVLQQNMEELKTLEEKMQSVEAERDVLLSEKKQRSSTEEMEELQEMLGVLRQEKIQLREHLDDCVGTHQIQVSELSSSLQALTEQKRQLEDDLQQNREEVSNLQELLRSIQEELRDQQQTTSEQLKTLEEKLQSVEVERDVLLSEKKQRSSSEELQSRAASTLSEEKEQLQEALELLRQEKNQIREQLDQSVGTYQIQVSELSSSLQDLTEQKRQLEDGLQQNMEEVKILEEKLQGVEAERDVLLSEKKQRSSREEMEELQSRAASLSEEKEQLQEALELLRQEKMQLKEQQDQSVGTYQIQVSELSSSLEDLTGQKRQLEDDLQQNMEELKTLEEKMQSVEAERDVLLSEKEKGRQMFAEEVGKLTCRSRFLSEEKELLQETLEALKQEKIQLEEKMENLQSEGRNLEEKLQNLEAERDVLLSEKKERSSSEELQSRAVSSLSEEKKQLQEALEDLRQEKNLLRADLEEKMESLQSEARTLEAERDVLLSEKKETSSREEMEELQRRVTSLSQEKEKLQETLEDLRREKKQTCGTAPREASSDLHPVATETASSRLQASVEKLQETFRRLQEFIDLCGRLNMGTMESSLRLERSYRRHAALPHATLTTYKNMCQKGLHSLRVLASIMEHLRSSATASLQLLEKLATQDVALLEERRLQDVLLCRARAPRFSFLDEDPSSLRAPRLSELLEKRQAYLQKTEDLVARLGAAMQLCQGELAGELRDRQRFKEQMEAARAHGERPDEVLAAELELRTAAAARREASRQAIISEQEAASEELGRLEEDAAARLQEEAGRRRALQRALEEDADADAPAAAAQVELLRDVQQLTARLQDAQKEAQELREQAERLWAAQGEASSSLASHKRATQLLQTELQDSRAQLDQKENTILTLRGKLRESEKHIPPGSSELQNLQKKLLTMEVKLSAADDSHQQEIQRLTIVLKEKEELVRKLKETLRNSQQEGEGSFLQGKELHARLTKPRGQVSSSALEEEVKSLRLKITELESRVSSQLAEISKWKNRAIKLSNKMEARKPSSPCTPTKRAFAVTSDTLINAPKKLLVTPKKVDSPRKKVDSPRKKVDSPRKLPEMVAAPLLDSPKSRFFDAAGSSDMLSISCPKQFFDNSSLGTLPEVSHVPDRTDKETDAEVAAGTKGEWWPLSPKQEDLCKTQ